MRAIPIGVVGVGHLGGLHACLLHGMAGFELVGIHDPDSQRAEVVATASESEAVDSLAALADRCRALVISVPTAQHVEVALAALELGVDLLVEKPLAGNAADGRELVRRAAELGRIVAAGHVERHNPGFLAACQRMRGPRFIEAHRLAAFTPRGTDVSVIHDLMIHDIDLVQACLDSELVRVDASGVRVISGAVDIANARLTYSGGEVANITASRVSRQRLRKIRFFQQDAYLSADLVLREASIAIKLPRAEAERRAEELATALVLPLDGTDQAVLYEQLPPPPGEPLARELQAFHATLSRGTSSASGGSVLAAEAIGAIEIADCIAELVEKGGGSADWSS